MWMLRWPSSWLIHVSIIWFQHFKWEEFGTSCPNFPNQTFPSWLSSPDLPISNFYANRTVFLPCPSCLSLFVLPLLPWPSCPAPLVLPLSCPSCPVFLVLSCPSCPALPVLSLSCPSCPALPVLSFLSCPSCRALLVLSLSCSCPSCPLLLILSFLSCPSCPVPCTVLFLLSLSCPSHPALFVLSFLSCPSSVLSVLLFLSCPSCCALLLPPFCAELPILTFSWTGWSVDAFVLSSESRWRSETCNWAFPARCRTHKFCQVDLKLKQCPPER